MRNLLMALVCFFVLSLGSALTAQGPKFLSCDLPPAGENIIAVKVEVDGVVIDSLAFGSQADHFRLMEVTTIVDDYQQHTFRAMWANDYNNDGVADFSEWSEYFVYTEPVPGTPPGQPSNLRMIHN